MIPACHNSFSFPFSLFPHPFFSNSISRKYSIAFPTLTPLPFIQQTLYKLPDFKSSSICLASSSVPKFNSLITRAVIAAARFLRSSSGRFFAISFVYPSLTLPILTDRHAAMRFENRSISSSSFVFALIHSIFFQFPTSSRQRTRDALLRFFHFFLFFLLRFRCWIISRHLILDIIPFEFDDTKRSMVLPIFHLALFRAVAYDSAATAAIQRNSVHTLNHFPPCQKTFDLKQ